MMSKRKVLFIYFFRIMRPRSNWKPYFSSRYCTYRVALLYQEILTLTPIYEVKKGLVGFTTGTIKSKYGRLESKRLSV